MDTWRDVGQVFKSVDKVRQKGFLGERTLIFLLGTNRGRERGKEESQGLLSTIQGVLLVGICRVKNQGSSPQRGLHVYTKKRDFAEDPKEEIWGKSMFSGLGGVLETSFGSTMLQKVEVLPTWVLLPPSWLI